MSALESATILKPVQAAANGSATLLQRKCACGNTASAVSGECEQCQGDKLVGVQTKLVVGASDDPFEREADRVADRVSAAPSSSTVRSALPRIQRITEQASRQAGACTGEFGQPFGTSAPAGHGTAHRT